MSEKIVAVLDDEKIEVLYKIMLVYFWDRDRDPGKEEEYRLMEPLYDELKAAMKRMYPERFEALDLECDELPF